MTVYNVTHSTPPGAGTGCALTNNELEETGVRRDPANLGPVTITGLKPNQSYVFAVAGFSGNGKPIGAFLSLAQATCATSIPAARRATAVRFPRSEEFCD
jgi:hypothetical protein